MAEYLLIAQQITEAVEVLCIRKKPYVAAYARDHGLPYDRLLYAYNGGNNRSTRPPINQVLDNAQLLALELYLDHIDRIGFGIRHRQVANAANAILAEGWAIEYEEPPKVGINWGRRWLKRYLKYTRIT